MLDGLFVAPAVSAVSEALGAASTDGKLAVIGNAKLASALVASKRDVVAIGVSARAAKKLTNAMADLTAIEDRSLAGVVGADIAVDDGWEITLGEWRRVVRDGGVLVFIDRGHAAEASRRALCSGLTEIEQRHVGRTVVTSGLVTHL